MPRQGHGPWTSRYRVECYQKEFRNIANLLTPNKFHVLSVRTNFKSYYRNIGKMI